MFTPNDRFIRVFVSSTFRDMQAERDHLVKVVFPELRRLCESRGVTWGEVDLRWGVTEEQVAEGKVLPICLEEIKLCRPYFIGLLGERYGWVPEAVPREVLDREPWIRPYAWKRKSVTELEILQGVLEEPKMAGHAFFYFRDPSYANRLPPGAKRSDYVSEDAESKAKLASLKQRLIDSPFPVWGDYKTIEMMGKLVLEDLTAVINQHWPEDSLPPPEERDAADHEAFARSRARVYIRRHETFEALTTHAANSSPPLVVLGESGGGKSALLANWALHHREKHPGDLLLIHFIGATPHSSDCTAMLRRIMGELKKRLGLADEIPHDWDELCNAFKAWLQKAANKGRIILILDALNQMDDSQGELSLTWLPESLPPNVRLIVSTLPCRALDELKRRGWPSLTVQPLSTTERVRLIEKFLLQYTKAISPSRAERIANAPQTANPLYLRVMLDELRILGDHTQLDERITQLLQSLTISDLYRQVLSRWESDYGQGTTLVEDSMSLLWAARRGLSESELLLALGKQGTPLPRSRWSPLFLAASDALVSRNGVLTFFHDYLRQAVRTSYVPDPTAQQAAHLRLADFFTSQPQGPRRSDELPWQLATIGEWNRLVALLTDLSFLEDMAPTDAIWCWARLQQHGHKLLTAYEPVLREPAKYSSEAVAAVGGLLVTNGCLTEGMTLLGNALGSPSDSEDELSWKSVQALILAQAGNPAESFKLVSKVFTTCCEVSQFRAMPMAIAAYGTALAAVGKHDEAITQFRDGITRSVAEGDRLAEASCSTGLVQLLVMQKKLAEAESLLKRLEHLFVEDGQREFLPSLASLKAHVCQAKGDTDAAMTALTEGIQEAEQAGLAVAVVPMLFQLSDLCMTCSRWDEALRHLQRAEQLYREHDMSASPSFLGDCLAKQANALTKLSRPSEAHEKLTEARGLGYQV